MFGLPRITHSQADYDIMVKLHDSPANTLCLCTGSLGSNPDNDIPAIIRHFGEMNRIGAMHVRNVKYLGLPQVPGIRPPVQLRRPGYVCHHEGHLRYLPRYLHPARTTAA